LKGEKYWKEAENYYKEAFDLGLENNKMLKAIALNNKNCLKWWDFYSKFEKELQSLLSLSQEVNINDEKAYTEREIHQKNLESMQKEGKIVYCEIVKGFKSALHLLECNELRIINENLNNNLVGLNPEEETTRESQEEYAHTKLCLNENETNLNFKLIVQANFR